jgi:hypothetical protein
MMNTYGLHPRIHEDPLPWLLEEDFQNPGIRFLALRDLLGMQFDNPELAKAQRNVMSQGPVPIILQAQHPDGYWVEPGAGYLPKYRSTVWQLIFLAQLGADGEDPAIMRCGDYALEYARAKTGGFSMNGTPSGLITCLQGNLVAALLELGRLDDDRLNAAIDWLARSITGEGIAPSTDRSAPIRYLRSGNSGPGFLCSANDHLPCAWGAVKAMLALGKIPESRRTDTVQRAIEVGTEFLLSTDPSLADYPMGYSEKPNRSWFKFGYPIGYVTDVLQNMETLTALGFGGDERLLPAVDLLLDKQDELGHWSLEYTYNGKTWVDVEKKKEPSKWVTLRALRVLSHFC